MIRTCGTTVGITSRMNRPFPPPLMRRLAGSSVIEAARGLLPAPEPAWPRAPRNAPVPPMIAQLLPCNTDGAPGGALPPASPVAAMLPIGVPSLFRISKKRSRNSKTKAKDRFHPALPWFFSK